MEYSSSEISQYAALLTRFPDFEFPTNGEKDDEKLYLMRSTHSFPHPDFLSNLDSGVGSQNATT